ncbi:hypothetical protein FRC17_010216 [Serendipita sp. 399]|nr:hypothetical protein FRC17_010216 [Serendipita sp. 399]
MRALFRKKNKKAPFSVTKSSPQVPREAHIEGTTNTTDSIVDTDARSLQKYKATSDISEHFFGLIKEISEATDLLSPLKAACALLIRGITLTRAMHNNEIDWAELCDELRYHQVQLEGHRDGLEKGLSTEDVGCLKALEYYMRYDFALLSKLAVLKKSKALWPRWWKGQPNTTQISKQVGKAQL